MSDHEQQDASQAAYEHQQLLMRQQEQEQAIRNCERALRDRWMDELHHAMRDEHEAQ